MHTELQNEAKQYIKQSRGRSIWRKFVRVLAGGVVFCTTYALILPAITMEEDIFCGIEEHVHTEECYVQCYDAAELVCSSEEFELHEHDESCYALAEESDVELEDADIAELGELICTAAEVSEHVHDDDCFEIVDPPVTCELEESEEHTHGFLCYGTWELVCSAQAHEHTLQCFSDPEADVEDAAVWEQTLTDVELTGVWADDVLAVAESQLGYAESTRNYIVLEDETTRGYTRYGHWYGDPYGDWNAMFASFCVHYAGAEDMPVNADSAAWVAELSEPEVNLFRLAGYYEPKPGDLIFFDQEVDGVFDGLADRVGIVAELIPATQLDPAKIEVIEGDVLDCVDYVTYDADSVEIYGYGSIPEAPQSLEIEGAAASSGEPTVPAEETQPVSDEPTVPAEQTQLASTDETQPAADIVLTAEGEDYVITVAAPSDAFPGVSADRLVLQVTERSADSEEYRAALDTLNSSGMVDCLPRNERVFDIKILVDGVETEPAQPVQVTFHGIGAADSETADTQIYHVNYISGDVEDMQAQENHQGDVTMTAPHFSEFVVFVIGRDETNKVITVETAEDLCGALHNQWLYGYTVQLENDITLDSQLIQSNTGRPSIEIKGNITLDLNGCNINYVKNTSTGSERLFTVWGRESLKIIDSASTPTTTTPPGNYSVDGPHLVDKIEPGTNPKLVFENNEDIDHDWYEDGIVKDGVITYYVVKSEPNPNNDGTTTDVIEKYQVTYTQQAVNTTYAKPKDSSQTIGSITGSSSVEGSPLEELIYVANGATVTLEGGVFSGSGNLDHIVRVRLDPDETDPNERTPATLILDGATLGALPDADNENSYIGNNSSANGAAVLVQEGATFEMRSGLISENRSTVNGGAVYIEDGSTMTMTGGEISNNSAVGNGGAVYVADGNVTMSGGFVKDNKANNGGGLYFSQGNFTMTGGRFEGNGATGNNGGAIMAEAKAVTPVNITIDDGVFFNNWANYGGAIYGWENAEVTINGGVLTENKAWITGGAIYLKDYGNEGGSRGGSLTINDGIIAQNRAQNAGGAIYVESYVPTEIRLNGGYIAGNLANTGNGGAVCLNGTANKLTMTNGVIAGNTAKTFGGGLYINNSSGNEARIEGGIISGNIAGEKGGGIMLAQYSQMHLLGDAYITNNYADAPHNYGVDSTLWDRYGGGGICTEGTLTMDGGYVTGNCSKDGGGGIFVNDANWQNDPGVLYLKAGVIARNTARSQEGGGIRFGEHTRGEIIPHTGDIYISHNQTRTTQDWGGGGIFVAENGFVNTSHVLVVNNGAGGFGGGVTGCPTGMLAIHTTTSNGKTISPWAVFDNYALGQNMSGTASTKNDDHVAQNNTIFTSSGYQDFFCAFNSSVVNEMMGGGFERWSGSVDYEPVGPLGDTEASLQAATMMGLTANSTDADKQAAYDFLNNDIAGVYITENGSNTHGGGIMCNGILGISINTNSYEFNAGIRVRAQKQYLVDGEEQTLGSNTFNFILLDREPHWEESRQKYYINEGTWVDRDLRELDDYAISHISNALGGAVDFSIGPAHGLVPPVGSEDQASYTKAFYLVEVDESAKNSNIQYDATHYEIVLTVTKVVEEKYDKTLTFYSVTQAVVSHWYPVQGNVDGVRSEPKTFTFDPVQTGHTKSPELILAKDYTDTTQNWDGTYNVPIKTTFENSGQKLYNFRINKVDGDLADRELENAEFSLYNYDEYTTDINNAKPVSTDITDPFGVANFAVMPGKYVLVETKAPANYNNTEGPWVIRVEKDENEIVRAYVSLLSSENTLLCDPLELTDVDGSGPETLESFQYWIKNWKKAFYMQVKKVDSEGNNQVLKGAKFRLFVYDLNAETGAPVHSHEHYYELVSDVNGDLVVEGRCCNAFPSDLPAGNPGQKLQLVSGRTYCLQETKAPDGYWLNDKEYEIVVTEDGVEFTNPGGGVVVDGVLHVPNRAGEILPETGGPGTHLYTMGGLLLLTVAVILLYNYFKCRKEDIAFS